MSHYRTPPAVLPSLRDYTTETAAIIREAVPDPIERGFLRWARRLDDYPFVAATLDDATREDEARQRAERAPCPTFTTRPLPGVTVGGYPLLRLRPPPTPIPSAGRTVLL